MQLERTAFGSGMTADFGQVIIGPPGSGKTTYCDAMAKLLTELGRKVAIINLDPANESQCNQPAVDVMELITVPDVMDNLKLGPNGALIYAMEFLLKNMDWLEKKLRNLKGYYFLFDCPGQVELYTHNTAMKEILKKLEGLELRLCVVQLIDSHYCSDAGKYIATVLMALSSMLQLGMPQVNVLSKIDLALKHKDKLTFDLEFYTEVLDLSYLFDEDKFTQKYAKLNAAIIGLVEDYSLVQFLPLSVENRHCLMQVRNAADKANGYVFGAGEERNVEALLACAVGPEYPHLAELNDDDATASTAAGEAEENRSNDLLWS